MQESEVSDRTQRRVDDSANMEKPPRPRSGSGNSDRPRSKRSSLIITHDDETREENDCIVTSLGFSNMDSASLCIEELGQKNKVRKVSYDNTRVNSPEIVTVDVHRDPEPDFTHIQSFAREKSPLLEIETLPNSPSPCLEKMSTRSLSPLAPSSPSISLSPSPSSSLASGTTSPHSWLVEANIPSAIQAQSDSGDSWGAQTRGGGHTEPAMERDTLEADSSRRVNTAENDQQQRKSTDDEWEMVNSAETKNTRNDEIKVKTCSDIILIFY